MKVYQNNQSIQKLFEEIHDTPDQTRLKRFLDTDTGNETKDTRPKPSSRHEALGLFIYERAEDLDIVFSQLLTQRSIIWQRRSRAGRKYGQ